MGTFTVELNFNACITLDVEASDQGEALSKARELADIAPMSSFTITSENNAQIINHAPGLDEMLM